MRRIEPHRVRRVHHREDPDELFDVVAAALPPDAGSISLLEPERLMRLMASWSEAEDDVAASNLQDAGPTTGPAAPGAPCALLRAAGCWLAVPAECVGELLRMPELSQRWPETGLTPGISLWRRRPVAVLDPARALGEAPEAQGQGDGLRALAIRRLIALVPAREGLLTALPGAAGHRMLTLKQARTSYRVF